LEEIIGKDFWRRLLEVHGRDFWRRLLEAHAASTMELMSSL
jgi:hypothetical protein